MLAENFPKKKIIKKKIEFMNQNNNDTILRKEKKWKKQHKSSKILRQPT